MKNTLLLNCTKILSVALIATVLSTTKSNAQKGDAAFNKGDNTIGFSIGEGHNYDETNDYSYGYGYGGYSNGSALIPSIILTFDHGFFENIGPGTIGIGGLIGYRYSYYTRYYNSFGETYTTSFSNVMVGFRGTYHLTILKDKNQKFDPYAGITLGLRISHSSSDYYDNAYYNSYYYNNGNYYNNGPTNHTRLDLMRGIFVGAKYNFSPHFGAFAEFGYDITLARIGLNVNF